MELTGRETGVFNASDLSISSSVSGPEVITGLSKMSRTGKEKERKGGGLQDGGFPTALRCRNNLPCCASPACCPQSRSCQTASRKGAGSSHALREGERQHTAFCNIKSIYTWGGGICLECVEVCDTHSFPRTAWGTRKCARTCSCCWACRSQTRNQNSLAADRGSSVSQSYGSC